MANRYLLLLLTLLGFSHYSLALSVGEIELQSNFGQPLEASIKLSHIDDLSAEQIKVKMADRDVQQQYQVSEYRLQQPLKIDWQRDGEQFTVTIQTEEPVKEPYLHFVLQVIWPEGKILKECKLLLDAP